MVGNVIISGTGRGVGKALANIMLEKGYVVVGVSRQNHISHPNFSFIKTDLSNEKKLLSLNFPAFKNNNHTILVNNAGDIGEIKPLGKRKNNQIILEYMANIIAPTIILNKFLKQVNKTSKTQHTVINISSGAAFRAITSWSTYCASKSALKMLNSCVNEEFSDVKSFSISPGIVDTDMQLKIRSADKETFSLVESFKDYHSNGDLETPDNVAKKILYVIENQDIFESNELILRDITI